MGNQGAYIVGLVFSTIGMYVGAAALVAAMGFGIAYLVYIATQKNKHSASRHLLSEIKCISGLNHCADGKSFVPREGDCDRPGPKRCCCKKDPSTCRILRASELKSSKNPFRKEVLVCPDSKGYHHVSHYKFTGIPSTCITNSTLR